VTLSQEGESYPVETVAALAPRPVVALVPPPPPRRRTRSHHSLSLTRRAARAGRPLRSHRAQGVAPPAPARENVDTPLSFRFVAAPPATATTATMPMSPASGTWSTLCESVRGRLRRGASTGTLARTVTSGPSASRLSAREGRTRTQRSRGRAPARRVPSVPSRQPRRSSRDPCRGIDREITRVSASARRFRSTRCGLAMRDSPITPITPRSRGSARARARADHSAGLTPKRSRYRSRGPPRRGGARRDGAGRVGRGSGGGGAAAAAATAVAAAGGGRRGSGEIEREALEGNCDPRRRRCERTFLTGTAAIARPWL